MAPLASTTSLVRTTLDTYDLNYWFQSYPKASVLGPLEDAARIVDALQQQSARIDADSRLTPDGKREAKQKARDTASAAITKWNDQRLAGLDADLNAQQAALLPSPTQRPDDRKIDVLMSHLQERTPGEIATLYHSATDDEQLLMEAASASVGRIPRKTAGGLEWVPLLDPDMVTENVMARVAAKNPQATQKLAELTEIRAMQLSVAQMAEAEIQKTVGVS